MLPSTMLVTSFENGYWRARVELHSAQAISVAALIALCFLTLSAGYQVRSALAISPNGMKGAPDRFRHARHQQNITFSGYDNEDQFRALQAHEPRVTGRVCDKCDIVC